MKRLLESLMWVALGTLFLLMGLGGGSPFQVMLFGFAAGLEYFVAFLALTGADE